jgi:hypothetical protein
VHCSNIEVRPVARASWETPMRVAEAAGVGEAKKGGAAVAQSWHRVEDAVL